MDAEFSRLVWNRAAWMCVECGKCVAVCPMAEMYPDFGWDISPRGMVQQALRGQGLLAGQGLWRCTQCEACTRTCPAGVDCCGLVRDLRPLARAAAGEAPGTAADSGEARCQNCGAELPPGPVLAYLRQALPQVPLDFLDLCPACRRLAYARLNS